MATAAERQRRKLTDRAVEDARGQYPDAAEILPSWSGRDCVLDVKRGEKEGGGWVRLIWAPDDDSEAVGIEALA